MQHDIDLAQLYDSLVNDVATIVAANAGYYEKAGINLHKLPRTGVQRVAMAQHIKETAQSVVKQYSEKLIVENTPEQSETAAEVRELNMYIESGSILQPVFDRVLEI